MLGVEGGVEPDVDALLLDLVEEPVGGVEEYAEAVLVGEYYELIL